jgi:predicted permease
LKLSESWKLAGTISSEVRFKAFLEANPSNLARVKEDPDKISKAIKSQSRMSVFFTAMILGMIAVIALAAARFDTDIGSPEATLAVGFAMYLTLSFVVIFFLNLTTTSGLFSSGAMRLPSTLPLTREEVEQLNFMTFVRIFIAPVVLSLTVFPVGCLLLFGPVVAIVSLIACMSTVSISIGALIRVSKWFHKKTHQTDESRISSIVRIGASIGIVVGMISVYSLGSYLPDLIRFIINLSVASGPGVFTVLSLLFPFSFGFLAASVAFGSLVALDTILASIVGTVFYSAIAVLSFRSSGKSLRAVTLGGISTSKPGLLKEVKVDIVSPLRSMVRKDLKLATRNIGAAFIFAIPIFLIVMLFPMLQFWRGPNGFLRSMSALTAVEYANLFGGISLVSILMLDTQGASVHEGLPVSSKLTLRTKTAIMIVPYVLCMIALDIVVLLNSPITPLVLLIPVIQIPMGYVIGMVVGGVVFKVRGGGRAVAINVTSDQAMGFLSAFMGAIVGLMPLLGFGLAMTFTGSQIISLGVQGLFVLVMIVASWRFIPKLLKD